MEVLITLMLVEMVVLVVVRELIQVLHITEVLEQLEKVLMGVELEQLINHTQELVEVELELLENLTAQVLRELVEMARSDTLDAPAAKNTLRCFQAAKPDNSDLNCTPSQRSSRLDAFSFLDLG